MSYTKIRLDIELAMFLTESLRTKHHGLKGSRICTVKRLSYFCLALLSFFGLFLFGMEFLIYSSRFVYPSFVHEASCEFFLVFGT